MKHKSAIHSRTRDSRMCSWRGWAVGNALTAHANSHLARTQPGAPIPTMRFSSQSRNNWKKHTMLKSLTDADKFSLDKLTSAMKCLYAFLFKETPRLFERWKLCGKGMVIDSLVCITQVTVLSSVRFWFHLLTVSTQFQKMQHEARLLKIYLLLTLIIFVQGLTWLFRFCQFGIHKSC